MDNNGLGKLLPKSITSRRRKKQSTAADGSEDSPVQDRSATGREGTNVSTTESDDTNSTNMAGEDTSLVSSYDSDHESPSDLRPTVISTHPSQIGYLTTSSPIVQAENLPEVQPASQPAPTPPPRSATIQGDRADTPDPPKGLKLKSSRSSLALPDSKAGRPSSPVGRFKDVFRSKKSSTGTVSPSPERTGAVAATPEEPSPDAGTKPNGASTKPARSQSVDDADAAAKIAPTERFRRLSRGRRTEAPPRTPPASDKATPVIVNTPPTPTDPRHPSPSPNRSQSSDPPTEPDEANASGSMIAQRRGRAASSSIVPSKLSNITLAPLTPTAESGATTPSASGFFSSMISAAQNATNSLSNTITNTNITPWNNNKKGSPAVKEQDSKEHQEEDDDKVEVEPAAEASSQHSMGSKELAVKTLGMGDLSLSQLGIVDAPTSSSTTLAASKSADSHETRTRSESAPIDSYAVTPIDETPEDSQLSRPRSLTQSGEPGDRTPPTGSVYEGKPGIQRSGSIRSAIGRRRKRGSTGGTGGTGTTIGAAIAAANASVAHPSAQSSTPKLTGFAVASKKRNRDFHNLFKSVPDDDYLIEDYSCALQREILAHGRLYVSEGHLCFSSNILGWVTTLVMSFDEIVSVEKRSTAMIFKNGLLISTLHAKHVFASFTSRDSTYDLIIKIWKLGHPSLQSSLNGVRIDETGGDKTEKIEVDESVGSQSDAGSASEEEDSDDGDDVYDEDEEHDGAPDTTQITEPGTLDVDTEKTVTRKPSAAVVANGASADSKPKEAPAAASGEDFPGPPTHAASDCGDATSHYDRFLADDIIPAPLGKTFSMMFGAASVSWMSKWLTNDQKCTDLQMEDQKGLAPDNKSRTYNYIKPLYASIGPKQTKCIVTEQVDYIDYDKAIHISCSTQNPDVPSGNVFIVKTKYCLSWADNNATRVQVNFTVEWTGKSWLKGPIEKGVNDGQGQHCKDLFASLKAAVSSRPRSGTLPNGAGAKGAKKRGRKGKAAQASGPASDSEGVTTKASAKQDWGVLEPLHGLLGPMVDIVRPLLTGNVMYGLLVGLLVASWFGFGFTNRQTPRSYRQDLGYFAFPDRLAAYEEMWRREESELWEWLEERVGMDRLSGGTLHTRKKVMEPRTVEEKLREDKMDDREVKEAIKVTEDKLNVLKSVMKKRGEQLGSEGKAAAAKAAASSSSS